MSEDTHAHHVLRAQAIHNDTKAAARRAQQVLRDIIYLTNEPERLGYVRPQMLGEIRALAERNL